MVCMEYMANGDLKSYIAKIDIRCCAQSCHSTYIIKAIRRGVFVFT